MTPFYQDELCVIYHGDCREVLPILAFDAVVSDPPYGIALDTRARYHANADHQPIIGDDAPFDPTWIIECGVPTILWGANHYCDRLPVSRGWLVWNKVIFDGAFGTLPMDKKQAEVELAWTNCVSRPKGLRHLWDGVFRDSEHGTRWHPAQKPVALMRWCLSLLPSHVGVVADPYMGAGPVLVAAKANGLRAIGIEVDKHYCELAVERLRQSVLPLEMGI